MTRRLPALLVLVLGALLVLVWMAGAPPEERVPDAPVSEAPPAPDRQREPPRSPRREASGGRPRDGVPKASPPRPDDGEFEPTREIRAVVVAPGLPGRIHARVTLRTATGGVVRPSWTGSLWRFHGHFGEGVHRVDVRPLWDVEGDEPLVSARVAAEQAEVTLTIPVAALVAGRVIDQDGTAVSNAPIHYRALPKAELRPDGRPRSEQEALRGLVGTVPSDEHGRFTLAVPPGSECRLHAFGGSLRSELATSASVTTNGGDTDVVIRIRWRPRIQLTVLDAAEQPVQGLQLRATWVGGPGTEGEGRASVAARSHPDGGVDFRDLREGRYAIDLAPEKAARKGYSAIESLTVETGRADAVLRVRRGLSIRGAVVDTAGKPVEDAEIEAHPADASRVELTTVYAISASDGAFELVGLAPGVVYELRAMSQEGAAGLLAEQSSGTTNARIELGERVAMRGKVERRFAGVRVELEHTDTGERLAGTVRSNGAVDLLGLRPGRHRVRVWRPGEERAPAELADVEATPAGRLALDLKQAFGE